ncbi:RIP homotypic interaction motif-containing protein [Riemerella columbipharyngis]|uniref:Head domain of trimeric autotransporter adhesin n=1 Tax=Riemerella columbipharyngis TaxID=1071918 RepID=A0A1G7FW66_9FLAO|nr:RIP homotypic interaction motif-containing protein [Riemerella columbipharyngis]SDE79995.1 Head domain of trimeric autotransporter adhesin [Riemerella columbipharyngis]
MKKNLINVSMLCALCTGAVTYAQQGKVGINTENPKATLDLKISNVNVNGNSKEGIIIPNVTSARAKNMGEDVEESTLVYITDGTTGTGTTSLVDGKGFYYFDATQKKWVKVDKKYTAGSGITINGNTISANVTGGTTYNSSTSVKVNGNTMERAALSGDVTAAQNSNTTKVVAIQGKAISNATPTAGQVLKWNGNQWAPAADTDTNTTYSGSTSVVLEGTTFKRQALTGDVTAAKDNNNVTVNKIKGREIADTAPSNGQVLKWDATQNKWIPSNDTDTNTTYTAGNGITINGNTISSNIPRGNTSGQVLKWNGNQWAPTSDADTKYTGSTSVIINGSNNIQRAALTGDVTAAQNNNNVKVTKLQGRAISNANPSNGQVLKWNGSQWAPAADIDTNTAYTGSTSVVKKDDNTFERAALTGDVTATQNSNNVTVNKIKGREIADTAPSNGQVLKWDATQNKWIPSNDTDTNTTYTAGNGITINGNTISSNIPRGNTSGQVLKWNGNQWAPAADTDTNTTYSGSTSVVLEGTTFKRQALTGDAVADKDSNEVTVRRLQGKFISATAPTNGQVLKWNAQQNQWIPAADTDTKYRAGNGISINGSNVISTNLRAGNGITINGNTISANVTGGTTYTNSTSVKVNGTTMERAALTGDVTATQNDNNVTVTKLRGKAISTTAPTNGQVLKWNGNQWAPTSDADTKYTGSTSVIINGSNNIQRAALTGDVTAAQNNNNVKVTKLQGRAISNANPSNGQVLKWNGNQWAPAADNGSTYTAGQGMNLGGPGHSANEFWRTGLEEISGNSTNKGLAIIGRTADNYGKIGEKAVDLSYSNSASTTRGATGNYSVAMGRNTTASSQDATAMGFQTTASGRYSTAMGLNTIASGQSSTAMGDRANASNKNAIAMGNNATASGENSVAIGDSSNASHPHAIAIGRNTKALGPDAMAIGALTTASGNNSTAIGTNTTATGDYSIAIGRASTASGTEAITLGGGTTSSGDYSTTMGQRTTASGNHAVAMGLNTTASGPKSVSMGVATEASGENAVVMGNNSAASGTGAVAMGLNTTASGDYSVAMGIKNTANGYGEVVIGNRATTSTVNLRDRVNPPRSRLFTIGNGDAFNGNLYSDAFTVLHNARVGINIDHFDDIQNGGAKLVVNGAIQFYIKEGDKDQHWSASDPAASMSCVEANEGSLRYIRTGTGSNVRGVFQGCRYTGSGYDWVDLHNK